MDKRSYGGGMGEREGSGGKEDETCEAKKERDRLKVGGEWA